MEITKLKIPIEALSNRGELVLLNVVEVNKYEKGKKTEEVEGYKIEVVAPANGYEKFSVRVPDKPTYTEKDFGSAKIVFDDFKAKVYRNFQTGAYGLTCTASSMRVLK